MHAVALGLLLAPLSNLLTSKQKEVERQVRKDGDSLEMFLYEASRKAGEIYRERPSDIAESLVAVLLKNNRFYVGLVTATPVKPQKTESLKLFVYLTGCRNDETKTTILYNDYSELIEESGKSGNGDMNRFEMIIRTEEVVYIEYFNIDAYQEHLFMSRERMGELPFVLPKRRTQPSRYRPSRKPPWVRPPLSR